MVGALDALLRTFGPFVIPVAVFVAGIVGYLTLVALGRTGVVRSRSSDDPDEGDGWERR